MRVRLLSPPDHYWSLFGAEVDPDALELLPPRSRSAADFTHLFATRLDELQKGLVRARERIVAGEIGAVLSASCTNRGTFPGGWFADPRRSGGGAIVDHAVHVVDVLRWITGKEVATIFAESSRRLHRARVEDTGLLMMTFEGGMAASLDTSWSRPARRYPTWGDVTLEFVGAEGVLAVDAFAQVADVYSVRREKGEQVHYGDSPDELMIDAFLSAVREGRPPPVTAEDGLRAVEVAGAALRSAATGRLVGIRRADLG